MPESSGGGTGPGSRRLLLFSAALMSGLIVIWMWATGGKNRISTITRNGLDPDLAKGGLR